MPVKMASDISEKFYQIHFSKGDFLLKEGSISNEYVFLTEGYMRSFALAPTVRISQRAFTGHSRSYLKYPPFSTGYPRARTYRRLRPA